MSSLTDLTQAQRTELRYVDVLHLVHITLPSGTVLYFSDIDYTYTYSSTSVFYDSYIKNISGLGNIVDTGGIANPSVNIVIKNRPWSSYNYLVLLNDTDSFVRANVSIYELRLTSITETFSSDIRILLWKGNVSRVEGITQETFTLACCSRLHNKKNALGLNIITEDNFPYSKPSDRGKYRNKIYGTLSKVPCRTIKDGAVDYLTTDINASVTSIPISGVTEIPFSSSGTVQIDTEKITYTGVTYSGARPTQLTGCTRGASSTTAAIHDKGVGVAQVLTEFIYEVANHPVESIDRIFVDDIRQTTGFTSYTGQTGSVLTGYEGTAVVRFTAKPYVGKQVNVSASTTTNQGSHGHTGASGSSSTTRYPSGATAVTYNSSCTVADPANAADRNESTYANAQISSSGGSLAYAGVDVSFAGSSLGTLSYIIVHFNIRTVSSGASVSIKYGSATIATLTGIRSGWSATTYSTSTWLSSVRLQVNGPGATQAYIHDCYIEYFYTAATSTNPAAGVSATTTLSGGTSTSTTVIGSEVTVDVDGYRDDASGTYTGTPSAIIQRPDHVFKHMLIASCGFTSGDIDTSSFTTAGSYYSTNTYNFGFLVHDIGSEADKVLYDLSMQAHSSLYEWGGKFYLNIIPSSTPTSNLTIDNNDVLEYPEYEYTNLDDIKNKIKAYYLRDYTANSGRGSNLEGVLNPDAMAEGFMDVLVSSTGSADLEDSLKLNAVRTSAMAQKILTFWLNYKSDIKLKVRGMRLRWKAIQIGPGQYFTYVDPMYGSKIFRVTEFRPNRTSGYIDISGVEAP